MIGKRTLNKCNSLTQDGPVAVPYSLYIFIDGIFFPFFYTRREHVGIDAGRLINTLTYLKRFHFLLASSWSTSAFIISTTSEFLGSLV